MREALLVVDLQNDFCPGGALAMPDGDAIEPLANRLLEQATIRTRVILPGCRAINQGGSLEKALAAMRQAGVQLDTAAEQP